MCVSGLYFVVQSGQAKNHGARSEESYKPRDSDVLDQSGAWEKQEGDTCTRPGFDCLMYGKGYYTRIASSYHCH